MAEHKNKEEALNENLADAGCSKETIRRFYSSYKGENPQEALKILKAHRNCLLENIHVSQRQLDDLDYLIHKIKTEKEIVK